MKRFLTLMLALLLLALPALAEETESMPQDSDRPAMDGHDASQRPDGGERGDQNGPGGRGGNGGGMAVSTEPDEALLAILARCGTSTSCSPTRTNPAASPCSTTSTPPRATRRTPGTR